MADATGLRVGPDHRGIGVTVGDPFDEVRTVRTEHRLERQHQGHRPQPPLDEVSVRQTGAITYALSEIVNQRIEAQQLVVFEELKAASKADLEKLEMVELASASA